MITLKEDDAFHTLMRCEVFERQETTHSGYLAIRTGWTGLLNTGEPIQLSCGYPFRGRYDSCQRRSAIRKTNSAGDSPLTASEEIGMEVGCLANACSASFCKRHFTHRRLVLYFCKVSTARDCLTAALNLSYVCGVNCG